MSGGSGTTQTSGPSGYIEPYLTSALDEGQNLYENNPLYRPGMNPNQQAGIASTSGVADVNNQRWFGGEALDRGQQFAANTLAGFGFANPGSSMMQSLAYDPGSSPYGQTLLDTAQGAYLQGGPMYAAAEENIRRNLPGLMSSYAMGGRSGSGLAEAAAAREVTDSFRLANQAERANQLGAAQYGFGQQAGLANQMAQNQLGQVGLQAQVAGMTPGMMQADYMAGQYQTGAGDYQERHQRGIEEEPWQRYNQWMGSYGPLLGLGGTYTSQERDPDYLSSAVGLGMTAAGLGWTPFASNPAAALGGTGSIAAAGGPSLF